MNTGTPKLTPPIHEAYEDVLDAVFSEPTGSKSLPSADYLIEFVPDKLGKILELGTGAGNFAERMLTLDVNVKIVTVDLYRGEDKVEVVDGKEVRTPTFREAERLATKERLSKFGQRAIMYQVDFLDALKSLPGNVFNLVFIDGPLDESHQPGWAQRSWIALRSGGVFAGTGYSSETPHVKAWVDELAQGWGHKVNEMRDGSGIWWFKK